MFGVKGCYLITHHRIALAVACLHLRQTEIQNLRLPSLRHKNVRGLDVTMDDALAVCGVERVRNLNCEINRLFHGQRLARYSVFKRLSLHELHRDEQSSPFLGDFVDGANVRVIQCGSGTCLTPEAFECLQVFR